jgi:CubicO group peptidase (beta-lactamase class C family)
VRAPAFDPAAVDRIVVGQLAANRIPGLALAITRGDEVLYVRGYGAARTGEPVTGRTQFLVASLSKSFTALAVLQLVEAGRVDLDAPVRRYRPDFALADSEAAARITVRQLLHQVSGLADTGFAGGLAQQQATLAARVASLRHAQTAAAPGAAFRYFDPNYQVLARLVEVVSGEPIDAYLRVHVFAPLGMRDTFGAVTADEAVARAERLAQGHLVVYGVPVAAQELSGVLGGASAVEVSAFRMVTLQTVLHLEVSGRTAILLLYGDGDGWRERVADVIPVGWGAITGQIDLHPGGGL